MMLTLRKIWWLVSVMALAVGFFGGCRSSKEAYHEEDDFFVPLDTAQQKPSKQFANAITPGSIDIQEGTASEAVNEFGAPLSDADIVIHERLSPGAMADSLNLIAGQVAYLQNILEASTIDPKMYYHAQVKSWTINNPALRDSLFYALLAIDSSMQSEAGTDAQLLATETNDLIEARFGTSVFKGVTLRQALEKSSDKFLIQKILQSSGYSKDVELRDTNFAIPTPLEPELLPYDGMVEKFIGLPPARRGMAELSLYGAALRVGPNWGAAVKFGNDELGLPFWSSGNMAIMATYKQLKVGFQLPMSWGSKTGDKFPLFTLRNRLLAGTRGIVAEADFGSAGGYFMSSRLTSSDLKALPDSTFYYVTGDFIGYYSFAFLVNSQNYLRVKVGGGFHQVSEGTITVPGTGGGDFAEIGSNTLSSYYMKIEYLHDLSSERFGGSIQFYDLSLLANAWLDIIPRMLSVDFKYVRIVGRNLHPWENPDFIIVSPKLTLSF